MAIATFSYQLITCYETILNVLIPGQSWSNSTDRILQSSKHNSGHVWDLEHYITNTHFTFGRTTEWPSRVIKNGVAYEKQTSTRRLTRTIDKTNVDHTIVTIQQLNVSLQLFHMLCENPVTSFITIINVV